MRLSIVMPAYNEGNRIGPTLSKIYEFLKTKDYNCEIIVVDDGSSDNTVSEAENSHLAHEGKLRVIRNGSNKGKGFSVKNGIINSRGEYILFSDADLSTPIEEVDKLFKEIDKGYDIVIGSRGLADSDVRVRQPWYRETMGRVFNFFIKLMLLKEFNDTQCGFKFFKGVVAKDIASNLKIDGFAFDAEILYIALKRGYKVKEVPVIWLNSCHSKVNPLYEPLRMFRDILLIRMIHRKDL